MATGATALLLLAVAVAVVVASLRRSRSGVLPRYDVRVPANQADVARHALAAAG